MDLFSQSTDPKSVVAMKPNQMRNVKLTAPENPTTPMLFAIMETT